MLFFSLLFSRFMSWLSCLYSVLHYFCELLTDLVNQELWSCYLYKLNYNFLLVIFHFLLVQKAWSRLSLNPYHSLRLFILKYWFLMAFLIPWDRTEHNLMLLSYHCLYEYCFEWVTVFWPSSSMKTCFTRLDCFIVQT
jgi:lipopolysaccharide biosynthesis glycosyltransferase